MKRLIVNADDFGMTRGVNRAILEANQCGIVTSATMMASGAEFDDAAVCAVHSDVDVGCHVVLVEGSPLQPARRIPHLTAAGNDGQTRFRRSFAQLIGAALSNRLPVREIEQEAAAQVRRVQAAGLTVTHLDTHKHMHAFPAIFRPLLRLAAELGVPAVRNPFEPPEVMRFRDILPRPALWARWLPVRALRVFACQFRRQARVEGIATTDGTIGITLTGFMDQRWLECLLESLPEGTWELLCHPAYEDDAWRALGPRPGAGEAEFQLLTSTAARRAVERLGIELISYRELAQEAHCLAA